MTKLIDLSEVVDAADADSEHSHLDGEPRYPTYFEMYE